MMPSNQILSNICKSIKIVIYLQYHNICQQSSCWHSQCGNMLKEEKYCENSETGAYMIIIKAILKIFAMQ